MQFTESIKEAVQGMLCPTHDIHPLIEQDWEGVKIHCCCNDFHTLCLKQAEEMSEQHNQSNNA